METFALGLTLFTNGSLTGMMLLRALRSANVESLGMVHVVPIAISLTSSLSAVSTWSGDGVAVIHGHEVFVVRWADWAITTPLIMYIILRISSAPDNVSFLTRWFVGTMIGIGFLCAIVHKDSMGLKWALFAWSSAVFFLLFAVVFKHIKGLPDSHPNKRLARNLTIITFASWLLYPAVFLLGDEFLGVVTRETDFFLAVILDQFAKVLFSVLLILLGVREMRRDPRNPQQYIPLYITGSIQPSSDMSPISGGPAVASPDGPRSGGDTIVDVGAAGKQPPVAA